MLRDTRTNALRLEKAHDIAEFVPLAARFVLLFFPEIHTVIQHVAPTDFRNWLVLSDHISEVFQRHAVGLVCFFLPGCIESRRGICRLPSVACT